MAVYALTNCLAFLDTLYIAEIIMKVSCLPSLLAAMGSDIYYVARHCVDRTSEYVLLLRKKINSFIEIDSYSRYMQGLELFNYTNLHPSYCVDCVAVMRESNTIIVHSWAGTKKTTAKFNILY